MELIDFKELLLEIAVCAMACDGDIDQREIEALHKIEKNSPYFSSTDLTNALEASLQTCKADINAFKKNVFDKLKNNTLNPVQELTSLEISLRIIRADAKEEDSEKSFINDLRAYLELDDFIIHQRFGDIEYLKPKQSEFKSTRLDDNMTEEIDKSN